MLTYEQIIEDLAEKSYRICMMGGTGYQGREAFLVAKIYKKDVKKVFEDLDNVFNALRGEYYKKYNSPDV